MTVMKTRGMLLLGLLGLVSLTGCESTIPPGGYGVNAIQFSDVVVPDGMSLRQGEDESYTLEVGSWRSGHLVYGGTAQVTAVSSYVLERMPQHAWELTADEEPDEQSRRLRFERGDYVAEYNIRRRENLTTMIVEYTTIPPGE